MKLRIKDNSFRFRITLRELEELERVGRIATGASFPTTGRDPATFTYEVVVDPGLAEGRLDLDGPALTLRLTPTELRELADPSREGVYLRRQWTDTRGATQRGIAFIEKDRPSSSCEKPEYWIYQDPFEPKA